jgi:uncharacterized protein YcgI (DUF1989 family)
MAMTIVEAGKGAGLRLKRGERVRIVNTHGSQVVDLFAHNAADLGETLSIQHSRNVWYRLQPRVGDQLWTQLRRPILTLAEDSSPGIHDTLFPCCDATRYVQLGVKGYHRNCADNWREALRAIGLEPPPTVPTALNLFMNVPVAPDGSFKILPPASRPGDAVVLKAEMDCVVALSSCPVDMLPLNGPDCRPQDVAYEILAA